MDNGTSPNLLDSPRPPTRGTPGRRGRSGLLSGLSLFLPWDLSARGTGRTLGSGSREPFLSARDICITVLVLGLLAAWVLEFAPLLHTVHAVRSTATVAASMAASGSGKAYNAARTWMEDLPGTGSGRLEIRRYPGANGRGGRVEATARLDYYPSTPIVRAFLPRVIHLEATEERDVEE